MILLKTVKGLTRKIIFLWHVILCEEWAFKVMHKEESKDGNGQVSGYRQRHCQNKTHWA